jgi:hypothetical protein
MRIASCNLGHDLSTQNISSAYGNVNWPRDSRRSLVLESIRHRTLGAPVR